MNVTEIPQRIYGKETGDLWYGQFLLNQIEAAAYAKQVIDSMPYPQSQDPTLDALRQTDVFRLRRGLCLPCAAFTCMNAVSERRLIGDSQGRIIVGDFFLALIPFHNESGLISLSGSRIEVPWRLVTEQGDVYHHAIAAFSLGFGIQARSIEGFSTGDVNGFLAEGCAVAASLQNEFVVEQTLGNDPRFVRREEDAVIKILIEGKDGLGFRRFERGRHVVAILAYDNDRDEYLVADSFALPQASQEPVLRRYSSSTIARYMVGREMKSRAMVFSTGGLAIKSELEPRDMSAWVPQLAVLAVEKLIKQKAS